MNDAYEEWLAKGNKPTQLSDDATVGDTRPCINCGQLKPMSEFTQFKGRLKCQACYQRRSEGFVTKEL